MNKEKLCNSCGSHRLAFANGRGKDLCYNGVPHLNLESEGYAIGNIGAGDGGDEVEMCYCLDCGKIQDVQFPIVDEDIYDAFGIPSDLLNEIKNVLCDNKHEITPAIDLSAAIIRKLIELGYEIEH